MTPPTDKPNTHHHPLQPSLTIPPACAAAAAAESGRPVTPAEMYSVSVWFGWGVEDGESGCHFFWILITNHHPPPLPQVFADVVLFPDDDDPDAPNDVNDDFASMEAALARFAPPAPPPSPPPAPPPTAVTSGDPATRASDARSSSSSTATGGGGGTNGAVARSSSRSRRRAAAAASSAARRLRASPGGSPFSPEITALLAARATAAGGLDGPLARSRAERVARWRSKRGGRTYNRVVRYAARKTHADARPRLHGRFATRTEAVVAA